MPIKRNEWLIPDRTSNGTTCVETMFTDYAVFVRNNLDRDGGTAVFTHKEWRVFIDSVKNGDYDT